MKKIFTGLAISALAATFAQADDYQFDVGANLSRSNSDTIIPDSTTIGLGIEFHFVPVDTSRGPLAEAAFINKSSRIYAVQFRTDLEETDENIDNTWIGAEVYIPDTDFYVGLDYIDSDFGNSDWLLTAGYLPLENLLITTSYREEAGYDPNISAKYLYMLDNGGSLVARGDYYQVEDESDLMTLGLDYYFNRYTGIGFNLEDSGELEKEIHVTHFFMDDAYAGLSYSDADFGSTIAISGGFRF
jgi:hypothetical protein